MTREQLLKWDMTRKEALKWEDDDTTCPDCDNAPCICVWCDNCDGEGVDPTWHGDTYKPCPECGGSGNA